MRLVIALPGSAKLSDKQARSQVFKLLKKLVVFIP